MYRIINLFAILSIFGLDRATKVICERLLLPGDFIAVFPGFAWTLRYNTGAAFSFLADGAGWQRVFFIGIAVCVVIWLGAWLLRVSAQERCLRWSLVAILGGALGNLYDRMMTGQVVDFILLYYHTWQWPAFNVADTAICVGACGLIFATYRL
jgi:signal peptidase II